MEISKDKLIKVTYSRDRDFEIRVIGAPVVFERITTNGGYRDRRVCGHNFELAKRVLTNFEVRENRLVNIFTQPNFSLEVYLINRGIVINTFDEIDRNKIETLSLAYPSLRQANNVARLLGLPLTEQDYLAQKAGDKR